MRMARFVVATPLCLFVACGSSAPSPSASAGGPAADAGPADAGSDAGAVDGGAGPADGGSVDAGPSDAGTGSGPGDAGVPQDGGTAANECDGLVPPGRPPLTLDRGVGSHSRCMGAITNPSGSAVGLAFGSSSDARVALRPMLGGAEFAVLETRQPLNPPPSAPNASEGLLFFPQPSGYQSASAGSTGFSTYSDTGTRLAFDPIVGGSGAPDPAGGTVMTFYQPQGESTPPLLIVRYDQKGVRRTAAAVVAENANPVAVGITPGGWTLALYRSFADAATIFGRWFDDRNASQGDAFVVAKSNAAAVLRPLADGRLALRLGEDWTAVFGQGEQGNPAPDWLSSRPGTSLFVVEGGRAYALPAATASACVLQKVEIVAVSGKACGEVSAVPPPSCTILQPFDIGPDGTLAQAFEEGGGSQITCGLQWWPGLLR
jgi:hypothetical protein